MELTVVTTRKKKIKVEFPLYMKHKGLRIQVIFKDINLQSVTICDGQAINKTSTLDHYDITNYELSTKEEFNKAYINTLNKLTPLI